MTRPRSVRAHDDVLDAALQLFADRGIDATSMDAVARASGVSKATIYKHWPDKDALCLEVLSRAHGADAGPLDADSGDLRRDLLAVLSHRPPPRHAELRMRMMPHLMAYAVRNPAFGRAWQTRVFEPPRAALARALARGVARGQLPATLNVDLAMALLLGPMMYGHLLKRMNKATPERLPDLVVHAFMKSFARAGAPRRTRPGPGRR